MQEIAEQERAWFEREKNANEKALKRMRALCPVGVTGLTVAQLEKRAMEAGSLYPRELALRLKENRLLQWTVEHPDDIARSNFLRGEHAHFFTNLDRVSTTMSPVQHVPRPPHERSFIKGGREGGRENRFTRDVAIVFYD